MKNQCDVALSSFREVHFIIAYPYDIQVQNYSLLRRMCCRAQVRMSSCVKDIFWMRKFEDTVYGAKSFLRNHIKLTMHITNFRHHRRRGMYMYIVHTVCSVYLPTDLQSYGVPV